MQGGAYAAKAITRKVKGKPKTAAFQYFDKGNMAVIGRAAAVADVFGVHLWGLPAWIVWAFIHLMYIVEFQSRIVVFVKWAIQDLTFSRGARLITGVAPTDYNFSDMMADASHTQAEKKTTPAVA
jgi:NADH dehydrogenase